MSIPTKLVMTRGDTRTITLTMGAGAGLDTVDGVKFTARVCAKDDDTVWAKTQADMTRTDTTAAYQLTAADWTAWESAGEPTEMVFDWEVTDGTTVATQGKGTIVVEWDVSR